MTTVNFKKTTITTYTPADDTHFQCHIGTYPQCGVAWIAARLAYESHRRNTAIDIGAHVGHMSFVFAHYFQRVHAFEPIPDNAYCCGKNMLPFRNKHNGPFSEIVQTHLFALSNKAGKATAFNPLNTNSGAWELRDDPNGDVDVRTLDSFKYEDVDLIKLDVQGIECEVLEGAKETIARCRPIILAEVINKGDSGAAPKKMIEEMKYTAIFWQGKQFVYWPTERLGELNGT